MNKAGTNLVFRSVVLVASASLLPWLLMFFPITVHSKTPTAMLTAVTLMAAFGLAHALRAYRKDVSFYSEISDYQVDSRNKLPIPAIGEMSGYKRLFFYYPLICGVYSLVLVGSILSLLLRAKT
jgi:hypothetical protein